MPRKISEVEYNELLDGTEVGFNHFMGGIFTEEGWPEIVAVNGDLWLFTAEEMKAIKLYKKFSLAQDVEQNEHIKSIERVR